MPNLPGARGARATSLCPPATGEDRESACPACKQQRQRWSCSCAGKKRAILRLSLVRNGDASRKWQEAATPRRAQVARSEQEPPCNAASSKQAASGQCQGNKAADGRKAHIGVASRRRAGSQQQARRENKKRFVTSSKRREKIGTGQPHPSDDCLANQRPPCHSMQTGCVSTTIHISLHKHDFCLPFSIQHKAARALGLGHQSGREAGSVLAHPRRTFSEAMPARNGRPSRNRLFAKPHSQPRCCRCANSCASQRPSNLE